MKLHFDLAADEFAICRLDPADDDPSWIDRSRFYTITRTARELSVIAAAANLPAQVRHERGWRLLALRGPFEFDAVGIAAEFTGRIAAANISLLVISTFDTDLLLIKNHDIDGAIAALRTAGHEVTFT